MGAISRAKLKGSPLGDDCKRANTTTEYGKHLCYGLTYDPENGIYLDKWEKRWRKLAYKFKEAKCR